MERIGHFLGEERLDIDTEITVEVLHEDEKVMADPVLRMSSHRTQKSRTIYVPSEARDRPKR
jgi:hypothetical protein